MSKIQQSIERLLKQHRIILWYDAEKTFVQEFESMNIPEVEKIIVAGNEFTIKVRILHTQSNQQFVLYIPSAKPNNQENWLLDIELAYHVFHTDQESIYLQEIGLGYHFKEWIAPHIEFFKSKERLSAFKKLIQPEHETDASLTTKLLQVVFNASSPNIGEFLRNYATSFIKNKHTDVLKELNRFKLNEYFWQEVSKIYNYHSEAPDIYDFLAEAFTKSFNPIEKNTLLNKEAQILIAGWQDTVSFQKDFQQLSIKIQNDLDVEQLLNDISLHEILEDDVFELIDKRIVADLSIKIRDESITLSETQKIIRLRQLKYWYVKFECFYNALSQATLLLDTIRNQDTFIVENFEQGFKDYSENWFKVDQFYRLFLQHYREAGHNNVLNALYEEVNKAYTNSWLLPMNDAWQQIIDTNSEWYNQSKSQHYFFRYHVMPYVRKGVRVFVIISDALRYEAGYSLFDSFQSEYRFEATMDYQVTMLPSYTQLGMAALLPHNELEIDKTANVILDGQKTSGLAQRKKILEAAEEYRATAIMAESLMKMNSRSQEAKELIQNHDVVYVYHNRIDKLGDDKTSEEKVVEAVAKELDYLKDLVKKISNANVYNILITSDHGFIYQHEQIDESDFSELKAEGDVQKINRRFVMGRNLVPGANLKHYTSKQAGLKGETDIMIPKSINRLRVQGAGSRFVHGGASLQEVVVPILSLKKTREDTVKKVDIDVLNKDSNKITTNIKRIKLYQYEPIDEGVAGRTLRIQFKSQQGNELSNPVKVTFDSASVDAKAREYDCTFQMSSIASTEFRNQTVELCLEEQIEGSNRWTLYKKYPYVIAISFTSDFDDF